jgi:peptidoglycan/LPS O-acetylase OafA/YrhL
LQSQVSESRLEGIDFLRGIAIVEMVSTHYAVYFPPLLAKLIEYTETAMPLFVLLAGVIVGWGYRKFEQDPTRQTWILWKRALRVLVIQYLMILTLGVPLYWLGMPGMGNGQSLGEFLFRSMFFLNQIGLLHILPTFVPLFAISPAVLFGLSRGRDGALLIISMALFCVGHFHPHLLDLGQPTIFPFILFQLYFVIGCKLGKVTRQQDALPPVRPQRWALASFGLLVTSMLLAHGKILPAHLISTHPLNFFGLVYELPLIATVWLVSLVVLPNLKRIWGYAWVARFGRHALLSFVIHVYLAMALTVLNHLATPPPWVNYMLIFLSILIMNAIVKRYELSRSMKPVPIWVRAAEGLFK